MNIQKDWKAKLESAYSFMLKYSKITVWVVLFLELSTLTMPKYVCCVFENRDSSQRDLYKITLAQA